MENKINIAELLKDCPKGMELDCTMYNKVTLLSVDGECICYPIRVKREDGNSITLTKYGQYTDADFAKCVIFPKGKTTWEGFVPPCKFKDGDIIFTHTNASKGLLEDSWVSIFKEYRNNRCACYACLCLSDLELYHDKWEDELLCELCEIEENRLATEDEKEKLFKAIKDSGRKWNPEAKTLEKLIEPKFKDGDIIADEHGNIAIYKGTMWYNKNLANYYCGYRKSDNHFLSEPKKDGHFGLIEKLHLTIEEEKEKFFQVIKDNGYKWNAETKTLEKLVVPKFEVGDIVRLKSKPNYIYTIYCLAWDDNKKLAYKLLPKNDKHLILVSLNTQDDYELVPNKFDINTLIPFESRVLVRDNDYDEWKGAFWSHLRQKADIKYDTIRGVYRQCIPYNDDTKHLLGKTNSCDEYFKNWK